MNLKSFNATLSAPTPPENLSNALEALWHQAKGDWQRAHQLAQEEDNQDGYWVHAYLHRVEGDESNAAYWYRRAGREPAAGGLQAEWQAIAGDILSRA